MKVNDSKISLHLIYGIFPYFWSLSKSRWASRRTWWCMQCPLLPCYSNTRSDTTSVRICSSSYSPRNTRTTNQTGCSTISLTEYRCLTLMLFFITGPRILGGKVHLSLMLFFLRLNLYNCVITKVMWFFCYSFQYMNNWTYIYIKIFNIFWCKFFTV